MRNRHPLQFDGHSGWHFSFWDRLMKTDQGVNPLQSPTTFGGPEG